MHSTLFPAYAGVILDGLHRELNAMSFPRIRGGDPLQSPGFDGWDTFSPHTRG